MRERPWPTQDALEVRAVVLLRPRTTSADLQHARLSPMTQPNAPGLLPPYWTVTPFTGSKKITT